MKKLLFGLLIVGLVSFSSVSFASDGPQTAKECVVDSLDVMETSIIGNEVVFTVTKVADVLFEEADKAFNIEFSERLRQRAEKNRSEFIEIFKYKIEILQEDYGVNNSNFLNTTTTNETNSLAYKYTCNDNHIQML